MSIRRENSARFLLAAGIAGWAVMFAFRGAAVRAGADDDDLTEHEPPSVRHQEIEIIQAQPADESNPRNRGNDRANQKLNELLALKVLEVGHTARLTETQRQKLLLAGQGDIVRLDDRVAKLRARYQAGPLTQELEQEMDRENRRTSLDLRGRLFADGSLFEKTLRKTLTAEQFARCEKMDQKRRAFQHRAGVHMTVLRLSTALGLSDDQWKGLEQLLLRETHPAQIAGDSHPAAYFQIVYRQMQQIPKEKLKPLFEPWQWRALQKKLPRFGRRLGGGFEQPGIFLDTNETPAERAQRLAEE
jgi:hypothetical protein